MTEEIQFRRVARPRQTGTDECLGGCRSGTFIRLLGAPVTRSGVFGGGMAATWRLKKSVFDKTKSSNMATRGGFRDIHLRRGVAAWQPSRHLGSPSDETELFDKSDTEAGGAYQPPAAAGIALPNPVRCAAHSRPWRAPRRFAGPRRLDGARKACQTVEPASLHLTCRKCRTSLRTGYPLERPGGRRYNGEPVGGGSQRAFRTAKTH